MDNAEPDDAVHASSVPEEPMTVEAVARVLDDCAAAQHSWMRMVLELSSRTGISLFPETKAPPTLLGAAADAVHYHVQFDEEGGRRVMLMPASESAGEAWPVHIESAPAAHLIHWTELAHVVTDDALRARFRHLLFQAKVGRAHEHARAAAVYYLAAARSGGWTESDSLTYAYASLRLAVAVGDRAQANDAAQAMKEIIESSSIANKPGISKLGMVNLASVKVLPFDFGDLMEEILPRLDAHLADQVLAAATERARPAERPGLWRRRIDLAVKDAEATSDGLTRMAKLTRALQIADRSGLADARRNVASLLQQAGRTPPAMMKFTMITRRYPDELELHARSIIGDKGLADGLERWAHSWPATGRAAANRRATEEHLAGSILWTLLPQQVIDHNHLPRFSGSTEQERLEIELIRTEAQTLAMGQPLIAEALRALGERNELPGRSALFGYLKTWPAFDPNTAWMAASALIRYWVGDYDGSFYIALPLIEGTVRHLVIAADEGVYRLQQNQKPGQYPGIAALLEPLARLYDLDEDWKRYIYVAVVHPTGLNLRNYAAHGFMGTIHPEIAAVILHLVMHLGTLQRRSTASFSSSTAGPEQGPVEHARPSDLAVEGPA